MSFDLRGNYNQFKVSLETFNAADTANIQAQNAYDTEINESYFKELGSLQTKLDSLEKSGDNYYKPEVKDGGGQTKGYKYSNEVKEQPKGYQYSNGDGVPVSQKASDKSIEIANLRAQVKAMLDKKQQLSDKIKTSNEDKTKAQADKDAKQATYNSDVSNERADSAQLKQRAVSIQPQIQARLAEFKGFVDKGVSTVVLGTKNYDMGNSIAELTSQDSEITSMQSRNDTLSDYYTYKAENVNGAWNYTATSAEKALSEIDEVVEKARSAAVNLSAGVGEALGGAPGAGIASAGADFLVQYDKIRNDGNHPNGLSNDEMVDVVLHAIGTGINNMVLSHASSKLTGYTDGIMKKIAPMVKSELAKGLTQEGMKALIETGIRMASKYIENTNEVDAGLAQKKSFKEIASESAKEQAWKEVGKVAGAAAGKGDKIGNTLTTFADKNNYK